MTTYRIVCTDQSDPPAYGHGHILSVGVGDDPSAASDKHTVDQVRRNLSNGDTYFTKGGSSGKIALVRSFDCSCGIKTIKSAPDVVTDNNLDNLRLCSWK